MPTGNGFRSSILRYLFPQKVPLLKNFDDVIACDLWFAPLPPNQKSWLRLCLKPCNHFGPCGPECFLVPFSSLENIYQTRRIQARRQDSVTGGGAEKNFGGHENFIYVNSKGARGTRNLSQSGSNDQGEDQKFKGIFRPKSEIQTVFLAKTR